MSKEKMITLTVVILVLLVAGGILLYKNFQGSTIKQTPAEDFAIYLGEHAVLYVQAGCIHCKEQEDLFGANARFLTIIDCLTEEGMQQCVLGGIESTPTWIINGEKYVGVQSIDTLKSLTGYQEK